MASIRLLVTLSVLMLSPVQSQDGKGPAKRNIKGQQYVRQTAVARLVGGPVPPELLHILQSNTTLPRSPLNDPPIDQKKAPHLVTDEVKTTITRMIIPLTTSYTDSERYLTMLRKFLVRNGLNLTHVDKLEATTDQTPSTSAIALKLQAAANLKSNIVSILGHIIAQPNLPAHHIAPLALIRRQLQLRRIPVIDLLEYYPKLAREGVQEQWVTVLSELEKHIPAYLKSCATFLLESLQEKNVNIEDILGAIKDPAMPKILAGIPYQGGPTNPANKPLQFPRRLLAKVKKSHEDELGRTMAAMLAAVEENGNDYSPRLLALFLLHLPRNTPNADFDDNAFAITYSQEVVMPAELTAVAEAFENGFMSSTTTPNELFQVILTKIVEQKFDGRHKYEKLLNYFEIATDFYLI